jgi:hypothetical protein
MYRTRLTALGLALSLLLVAANASSASDPNSPTVFAALSDWGGTGAAPFTTPAQLALASALANVSEANDVQFVLSAGNNFLPAGLPLVRRVPLRLSCCWHVLTRLTVPGGRRLGADAGAVVLHLDGGVQGARCALVPGGRLC